MKLRVNPDPLAAVGGAVLTIASVFKVQQALGISADELGMVMGAMITIAAVLRTYLIAKANVADPE